MRYRKAVATGVQDMAVDVRSRETAPRTFKSVARDLINVTKPGITLSNAMMTFVGIWLGASRHPAFSIAMITLAGSSLVVMGGCAMNNFMDRDIDQLMTRTQRRPLPDQRLSGRSVILLGAVLSFLGVAMLCAYVNLLAAAMALIGLFFYVIVYTGLTKRTTTLSTVIGSVSGAMPPLIGWTAMTNSLSLGAWLLFLFMFIWQPPHFWALSMRRVKEYSAARIPLLPVKYGFAPTKRQIVAWTVILLPASLLLYVSHVADVFYLISALFLGGLWIAKALRGFRSKDDIAWATEMFKFSLIYLTGMAVAMVF
ncbi:heme o synthase [Ferroacidibacillus organovorans]|uniref:Protoheme IX farnesyltransferase n=1 Tax=Ferroacidibacillus organovorans TaxID=1765683 RepID=A0A124IVU2_9BACL|nr:heme o synthase [Ferroacidibacillus organovorans]KUO95356.1 hypothetical protein ATW55_10895 [Ferroacidibacillus organovorans]